MNQTPINVGQNFLAGLTGGMQAGQNIRQANDQNALRNIFATQDINDPAVQQQIMGLDPRTGMALQNQTYQREQDTYQRGRQVKADARADETFKMKADEYARGLSADEAARTAAKVEQGLMAAIPLVESGNLDGLNQLFTQYGIDPVTSVEQATAALGQYQTVLGALKSVRDLNAGPKPSESEAEITRMMSTGMPRDIAIKIKEGIYKTVTDPTSREAVVIDLGSGQPVYRVGMGQQDNPAQIQSPTTEPLLAPDATSSFGIEGIAKSGINAIADTAGIGAPFEDVQTTVSDFATLRESLINDIASGYARQPPSWLLQNIRDLTPSAGGLQGASNARSKLQSLKRSMQTEMNTASKQAARKMSPAAQEKIDSRIISLSSAIDKIDGALQRFGGAGQENKTKSGVTWSIEK